MTENAQLFDAHRAGLCRYLTRIVGQPDTARDLTQEVFLRVSRTTVPEGSADGQRAWVFRIARNLALNHLRDQQRRPATTSLIDVGRTGTQELSVAVQQALEALPELDRDVFLLKESAGLDYSEIATAWSPGEVLSFQLGKMGSAAESQFSVRLRINVLNVR